MKHDAQFARWLFGLVLWAAAIGLFGFVGCRIERTRFSECVKNNTDRYCVMQHPLGAH